MRVPSDPLVLGAGPVGLIAAYLSGATFAIGEKPGGGSLRNYAPTYLWRTEATEELLTDLAIPWEPEVVRFGYLGDDGVSETFDEAERLEYFRRSRGVASDAPVEVPRSVMSSGRPGELETFNVSVDELVEALLGLVEVRKGTVKAIGIEGDDLGRKVPRVRTVCDGSELLNRIVINTLPAPVFDRLLVGRERMRTFRPTPGEWRAGTKTFHRVRADSLPMEIYEAFEAFEYLYVVARDRTRYPFDRVTLCSGGVASLEFNGEVPSGWEATDGVLSGPFQVRGPSRDPVEFGGAVRHVGRLARWKHDLRLHDVVKDLYD